MTINIGINLAHYIILAADTRTVFYGEDQIIHYTDYHEKIMKTKIGLITGAGYTNFLDDVKKQVSERDIKNTSEITDIIIRCREKISSTSPAYMATKCIKITSWMFTYNTLVNGSRRLRLTLFHPQFNDMQVSYEKNKCCLVMPNDATKEEAEKIASFVNEEIIPLEDISQINENINYHVTLLYEVIKAVSEYHDSVSRSFQAGVHFVDGKMGISRIIDNEPFPLTLS